MNAASTHFQLDPRLIGLFIGLSLVLIGLVSVSNGQIEGFTEPYRTVDLSSDETGTIAAIKVEQGEAVQQGDLIAKLDDSVQTLQLELAQHLAKSESALHATEKAYEKRIAIHARIQKLIKTQNASESELIRAEMELSIAKSKLLSAKEDLATREIEARRAAAQLERRSIRAPFTGIIDTVHRREGEFISPLRPEVVTIVQLDRLFATFNVPSSQYSQLKVGQEIEVQIDGGQKVTATVHRIGVQTDAQSGTVEVKLIIDNPNLEIRSGEICSLNI
jgi:RND family efflux transporter MFP subunit